MLGNIHNVCVQGKMKYKIKYPIQPPFETKRKERLAKGGKKNKGDKRNTPNFRRSKLWTLKLQQIHNYQQLNQKKKPNQDEQTIRTGTESQKWRSHEGLSAGRVWGENGGKDAGIKKPNW